MNSFNSTLPILDSVKPYFLNSTLLALVYVLICSPAFAADAPPSEDAAVDPDPDIELATRLERAFQKLAKRVEPCVVSLKVEVKVGTWLDELQRMSEQFGTPSPDRQFEGSGVLVEANGLIVTNEHVIRNARHIRVRLNDGRTYDAEVCGTDPRSDLAMIKLVGDDVPVGLPCVELADSDKVEVGQWALAVGNPFGLANSFTVGVISACGRNMRDRKFYSDVFYGNLIQTDAAINPGNSGGPLFDLRGKLIGINTMIFSKSGISQGFGFAIPSNHLKPRLAYLKTGREVEYGWLGVQLDDLRAGQKEFKVPDNMGVLVRSVIPNTPADRAGLLPGSIILYLDGIRIRNSQDLIAAVNEIPVGRKIKLKILDRSSKQVEISVRISKRYSELVQATHHATTLGLDLNDEDTPVPDLDESLNDEGAKASIENSASQQDPQPPKVVFSWRGMNLKELSLEDGLKRGGRIEIVRVKKGTPADCAGLFEGAIITELKHGGNDLIQKFNSLDEFKLIVNALVGPASLYTTQDGFVRVEEK